MYPSVGPCIDAAAVRAYLAGQGAPSPVVVGGTGGSGTRMVVEMLRVMGVAMGSDCNVSGDAMPFVPLYDRFNNPYLEGRVDKRAFVDQLLDCMTQHRAAVSGESPWGWKNPRSIYLLPLLDNVIPDLRFVHVVRDGLAMSSSANQAQLAKHGATVLPVTMRSLPDRTRSLVLWSTVNTAAADYGQTMGPRYMRLRYEDMCADPSGAMAQLASGLGLQGGTVPLPVHAPRLRGGERLPEAGTAAHDIAAAALQRFGYPC